MKKTLAALALTTFAFSAFADTSANLLLKGSVAEILEVSVAAETVASNLNLSASFSDLKVARVTSKTNRPGGLKLYVSSTNGGKLVHTTDSTSKIDYSLKYGNSSISLNSSPSLIADYANKGTNAEDVKMAINNIDPNLSAGIHQDTVTFTVVGD